MINNENNANNSPHSQNRRKFPYTRAQSMDFAPVSVAAEAENRGRTPAYHTESGETTNVHFVLTNNYFEYKELDGAIYQWAQQGHILFSGFRHNLHDMA